ncbi:prepilin-type N-terminal cleavage/methylation domain-containing protein [Aceticella autotrophica]|uniref:Prepilin-type N-terminal cleavage/methylation domain-containing protein n=1 Tax=Aceticella autotrophica TaxID=2755338 RepID=A0A975GB75_9THEO|nr:prepilin-type N-terminal cleavage/methylation domain-containing protein [Aceticella autotrophica]QSZ28030.1 prepilin-type N-terminal cleavage/methylation domain-containing protein [Aceticella autotrophica]
MHHLLIKKLNNKGFTLIELVVTVAIVVVAAFMLAYAMIYPLQTQADSEKASTAAFLAQEKAEQLKADSYDNLDSYNSKPPETDVDGYKGFNRTVTVEKNIPDKNTKQITVEVTYPLIHGGTGTQMVVFERTVE